MTPIPSTNIDQNVNLFSCSRAQNKNKMLRQSAYIKSCKEGNKILLMQRFSLLGTSSRLDAEFKKVLTNFVKF